MIKKYIKFIIYKKLLWNSRKWNLFICLFLLNSSFIAVIHINICMHLLLYFKIKLTITLFVHSLLSFGVGRFAGSREKVLVELQNFCKK